MKINKQQIEIIITVIAAIILILVSFRSVKRGKRNSYSVKSIDAAKLKAQTVCDLDKIRSQMEKIRIVRDPFNAIEQEVEIDLILTGIIEDAIAPQAIINDIVVSVGDIVDGYTVLDISKHAVYLQKGLEKKTLSIEQ